MIDVRENLSIPDDEIAITVSTSSGPGGQNVNRVRTRVTLSFNVPASRALTEVQKAQILERLGNRVDSRGNLRVRCQKHRTQAQNRVGAGERLAALLREALAEETPRRRTRKPRSADARRLEEKRRRGRVKADRREPWDDG